MTENEIDHVFIGTYNGEVKINKEGISDFKWISIEKLKKEFIENPIQYTVWLKIALKKYLETKRELFLQNFLYSFDLFL